LHENITSSDSHLLETGLLLWGVGVAINDVTFQAIFDQSPFSIQILSPEGLTLKVNAAWEKLWGLKLEQLQGYNMLHDEQLVAKGIMPYIRRGFAGESLAVPPALYDPASTIKDGKPRWVRAFISPLKDAEGLIQNVVLVHEDVTHRMRTGETLHKSKKQLAAILDALTDCVSVQDRDGNVVYANEAAARLMGFDSAAALINASADERLPRIQIFDEEGQPLAFDSLPGRQALRTGSENEKVMRFFMVMTGEEYWAIVRGVPVFDVQGRVRYAISIFHDITERRRNEQERQQLLERIESKRAMLEAVLHQLPMGVLIVDMPSGKMLRGNKQFSQIWRYPTESFENYAAFRQGKGFHPDGRPIQVGEWPLERALRSGEQVHNEEIEIVRGDNTRATIEVSAGPIRDAAGNSIAAVVMLDDVTERKQAEEQIRFQARLLETVGQAVIASDVEGNITYWNQASEKLFGWSRDEVHGKNVMAIMPTDASYAPSVDIMELVRSGQQWRGETEVRHRNGHNVPLLTVLSPVMDERRQVVGIIGTSTDLTERKRQEEGQRLLAEAGAVLASSLDYTTTLESVARLAVPTLADWCSVDVLDEEGNLRRLAIAHQDPAKVAWGYELYRRYPPDPNAPVGVTHVMRTGQSELIEEIKDELLVEIVRKPELLQIVRDLGFRSAMNVPLVARGRILGVLSFVSAESGRLYNQRDLEVAEELARRAGLAVDNALLYQEAQQAREVAEVANRSKDEFLATLSHELRTPLTAMVGWTDLMRNKMLTPEQQERALEVIARSTRTQTQLIEDLLDVSRIITGKLRIRMQRVPLGPIVEAAVETVRPAAEAKKLKLHCEMTEQDLYVAGDEARLQQVVWNLMANAVKFTAPEGVVEVTLSAINDQACLQVRDNGRGIAAEFLPHVFDRFRQADSTSTRNYGGLGLGLSIVRHLVEMHGGNATVQSEGEGQGAVFTITLPLLRNETASTLSSPSPDKEPIEKITEEVPENTLSEAPIAGNAISHLAPQVGARLRGIKVLVVEDNDDTREFLSVTLNREAAIVQTAAGAREAMEKLLNWQPDVLVCDIGMPETDGYEFIQQVRALPPGQDGAIPAVALTAFARKEDRARSLTAGFQEHLSKPVQIEKLVAAIQQLVSNS
jgi:PAS domain S-box-containing protein